MKSGTSRLSDSIRHTFRFSDPQHIYLRRALRLAVLFPIALYVEGPLLQLPQVSVLFGLFACFSLTTMCDFGGPYPSRAAAYAATVAMGWVSITLASAMSDSLWTATLATLGYGFAVTYSGVLRGYFAAAVPGVFVGFFLAISSPRDWDNLGDNLIGWTVGASLAAAGALVLWPMRTRALLRHRIADVHDATASLIESIWVPDQLIGEQEQQDRERRRRQTLRDAVAAMHAGYSGVLRRPGATTGRQRYLPRLVTLADGMASSLLRTQRDKAHDLPGDRELAATVAAALRDAAKVCRSRGRDHSLHLLDVDGLNGARERQLTAIENWVADSARTLPSIDIVVGVRHDMILRRLAGLSIMAVAGLREGLGADPVHRGMGTFEGRELLVRLPGQSTWRNLWLNLTPASVWFRNSIRAGVAYALSVAVILLTGLDHGFWIALGVMVALQSDATNSRSSVGRVLIGTVIGLVIGNLIVWWAHGDATTLWLLLALTVALATFAPGASTPVAGQAAFTMFLMVLFALLLPGDERTTAASRLVDVLVAMGVTLAVSMLLWPKGAAALVARSLAEATFATGHYLVMAFRLLGAGNHGMVGVELATADRRARIAYHRAAENFDLATSQRVPNGIPADVWSSAAAAVVEALLEVDKVTFMARELDLSHTFPRTARKIESESERVASAWTESICESFGVDITDYYPEYARLGEPLAGLTADLNSVVARALDDLFGPERRRLSHPEAVHVIALIVTVAALSALEHSGTQVARAARERSTLAAPATTSLS